MANYYSDHTLGNDANAGTIGSPWAHCPGMGGWTGSATLSAGDFVYFKKGETWREQLTVPSSGSAGNVITFGAYGSGANPIINGSTVTSSWTQDVEFSDDFETGNMSKWAVDGSIVADTESKYAGSYGAHIDYVAGARAVATITSRTLYKAQFRFKVNAETLSDGVECAITCFGATTTIKGAIEILQSAGKLYLDVSTGFTYTPTATYEITTGVWYLIELEAFMDATSGYYKMWVDGDLKKTVNHTDATEINRFMIGTYSLSTDDQVDVYWDNVYVWNSNVHGGQNLWYASSIATDPRAFIRDDTLGVRKLNKVDLATLWDYWWDDPNDRLYVFATANPTTLATTLEIPTRQWGIFSNGKDYVTFQNLLIKGAYHTGLRVQDGSNNLIISNLTATLNGVAGIGGSFSTSDNNILVDGCTASYNVDYGICPGKNDAAFTKDSWTVQNCVVHHNNTQNPQTGIYPAGIAAYGAGVTNLICQNNQVYSNGMASAPSANDGYGIWYDTVGAGCIIRYNLVYDNTWVGIFSENNNGVEIYYSLVYGHNGEANIKLGASGAFVNQNNKVYNNVCYNGLVGISNRGTVDSAAGACLNNLFRNNILVDNSQHELQCYKGGENDGTMGSGNVYTYNCLGVEASNFIEWGSGVHKSTYDLWETAYGGSTYSVEADPLFITAGTDFHLQSTSPCINKGTPVGLTIDYEGKLIIGLPDIGAYEYQYGCIPGGGTTLIL